MWIWYVDFFYCKSGIFHMNVETIANQKKLINQIKAIKIEKKVITILFRYC